LPAAHLEDACGAAEEGDQQVVDSRVGACLQLRGIHEVEGGHQEVERRRQERHANHDQQVLARDLKQADIVGAQGETQAENGAHQRRNEHGADDDSRGVDIQPYGCDDDGEAENPQVGTLKGDVGPDGLGGCGRVHRIVDVPDPLQPFP